MEHIFGWNIDRQEYDNNNGDGEDVVIADGEKERTNSKLVYLEIQLLLVWKNLNLDWSLVWTKMANVSSGINNT